MARLDRVKNLSGLAEWFAGNRRLRKLVNLVVVGTLFLLFLLFWQYGARADFTLADCTFLELVCLILFWKISVLQCDRVVCQQHMSAWSCQSCHCRSVLFCLSSPLTSRQTLSLLSYATRLPSTAGAVGTLIALYWYKLAMLVKFWEAGPTHAEPLQIWVCLQTWHHACPGI